MHSSRKLLLSSAMAAGLLLAPVLRGQPHQGAGATDVLSLRLEDAVAIALEHNPDLMISRTAERISKAEVQEIASQGYPQLSLESVYTRNIEKPAFFANFGGTIQKIQIGENNAYTANLLLRQKIFENGQIGVSKARRAAALVAELTRETTNITRDEIVFQVKRAFYSVLLSREVIAVFEQSLGQAEAHLASVKKQYEQGMAAEFDVLRAEVQVAEVNPALIEARNNLQLALDGLKTVMGVPLDKEIVVQGELMPHLLSEEFIAAASARGLERRPEFKQLALQEDIARINLSIQKGRRLPALSVSGNYQFQGQSNDLRFGVLERNRSLSAMVNLSFNIFNGFDTAAKIDKARAQLNQTRFQQNKVTQAVQLEIQRTRLQMHEARERIQTQQKSVQQAEKAYQIASVRYNQGVGTQLELFDAQLALNRIKSAYLQAVYDYDVAMLSWQKAVGNME